MPAMKQYSARAFEFANLSARTDFKVIDVACGPGSSAHWQKFCQKCSGASFLATDFSQGMVDIVKEKTARAGWTNVEAKVMDAMVNGLVPSGKNSSDRMNLR